MITLDEILKLRELVAKATPDWDLAHVKDLALKMLDKNPEGALYLSPQLVLHLIEFRNSAPDLIEIAIWAIEAKDLLEEVVTITSGIDEDGNYFDWKQDIDSFSFQPSRAHLQKFPKGSKEENTLKK